MSMISGGAGRAGGGLSRELQKQEEDEEHPKLPACQVREGMQAGRVGLQVNGCSTLISSGQISEQQAGFAP